MHPFTDDDVSQRAAGRSASTRSRTACRGCSRCRTSRSRIRSAWRSIGAAISTPTTPRPTREFGGRIFSFDRDTGARTLAGSTNYYSLLIQFANPVSVQAMTVATGPYGEQLFIADALNQRITNMTLPFSKAPGVTAERNISQNYAVSPLFQFGPGTALAMRPDLELFVTQNNNVIQVGPFASNIRPLFTEVAARRRRRSRS